MRDLQNGTLTLIEVDGFISHLLVLEMSRLSIFAQSTLT